MRAARAKNAGWPRRTGEPAEVAPKAGRVLVTASVMLPSCLRGNLRGVSGVPSAIRRHLRWWIHSCHSLQIYDTYERISIKDR
jgi:hypothetical protein